MMEVESDPTAATSDGRSSVNSGFQQPTSSDIKLDVIVVGAGLSGLATAVSTALSGHNVKVFETAKQLLEVRWTCAVGTQKNTGS